MSKGTNRVALRGLPALLVIGAMVWHGCLPEAPRPEFEETVLFATPSDSSVACYRIPALDVIGDVVLAAVDERVPTCADMRANRDINILLRRSTDRGQSWSPAERVLDYPDGVTVSDASFIVDRQQGRVFMIVNVMDHDQAPGEYRFHVIHSDDAGASWSAPRDITDDLASSDWEEDFKFVTSGHGTQAPDGTLLHTVVNLQRGVHVLVSDDHGASWHLAPSSIVPGDESKIIAFDDGRWMVNSRVADAGHRWVHISRDRGRTWTSRPDSALIDPAVNASLLRTANGLLFVGAEHPSERRNLTVRLSADEGMTWRQGAIIHEGSAAYASAISLGGKQIGVLYERTDFTENVFVRLRVGDR